MIKPSKLYTIISPNNIPIVYLKKDSYELIISKSNKKITEKTLIIDATYESI
jgi:hypothetical protein